MNIPENINIALKCLEKDGFKAYLVGGCVRDALLEHIPHDYDITTDAEPYETESCFADRHVIKTGLKHGTVTVMIDGEPIEITTMRTDGEYSDGRRPDSVSFTRNITEDLARRDFTINAMAYNQKDGFVDPFGGREDLKNGMIRTVGKADERFNEDALRILRALRFSSRLGFAIEDTTAQAIHENKGLLRAVSKERIFVELKGILCGRNAEAVLNDYSDVLCEFIPELASCIGFEQNNRHHIYDVYMHTVKAVASVEEDATLRLAVLFHDIAKPQCETRDEKGSSHFYGHPEKSAALADRILRRLKCDNKTRETVVRLIKYHDYRFPPTEKNVKRLLSKLDYQTARLLIKVKRADLAAQAPQYHFEVKELDEIDDIIDKLEMEDACVTLSQLKINGNDLARLGFKGRQIGIILNDLLHQVIDGKVNNQKDALLEKVRNAEFDG